MAFWLRWHLYGAASDGLGKRILQLKKNYKQAQVSAGSGSGHIRKEAYGDELDGDTGSSCRFSQERMQLSGKVTKEIQKVTSDLP